MSNSFNAVLIASLMVFGGCKSTSKSTSRPAATKGSEGPEVYVSTSIADEYYSKECGYRVAFPQGTRVTTESSPAGDSDGARFEFHLAGEVLRGQVEGTARNTPMYEDLTSAERCERSIDELQDDRGPSHAPPLVVSYKVVKPDWYVFSGTRGGEIVYEKGLRYTNLAKLRLSYPTVQKGAFDPVAARIASSFGEYLVITAKAGVMVGDEGEPGLLFLNDVPDDDTQQITVCAIEPSDRPQFAPVKEGQAITVGGHPNMVNVRAQTEQNAAIDHRRLEHCVLKPVRQ